MQEKRNILGYGYFMKIFIAGHRGLVGSAIVRNAPEEYEVIAVVFKYSGDIIEKIHKSSCKRNEELKKIGKSKNIPLQAIKDMHRKFEYPEYSEGFNKIIDYESYINKTKI